MLLVSFLGAMIAPTIIFLLGIQVQLSGAKERIAGLSMASFYHDFLLFNMLMFGVVVYAVMGAHLFSREYAENTLKTILAVPVKKHIFIIGKFAMLFIWIVLMVFLSWANILIFSTVHHLLFGLPDFSVWLAFNQLGNVLLSGALMYITISPFVFLSMITKGFIVPVIASAAVSMATVVVLNGSLNTLWPWAATYLLISNQISQAEYPFAIGMIVFVSIVGFALCVIYFQKKDVAAN